MNGFYDGNYWEIIVLQRKVTETNDPMEKYVAELVSKKMRLYSNYESEEESSKMKDVSVSIIEKIVI